LQVYTDAAGKAPVELDMRPGQSCLAPVGTSLLQLMKDPQLPSAKARTMTPINSPDPSQQARTWAERLGSLAAASPATDREPAATQLGGSPAFPARLSPILDHFRQRHQRRQHAADTLRAEEFLSGT
jgi:hypothetical protein